MSGLTSWCPNGSGHYFRPRSFPAALKTKCERCGRYLEQHTAIGPVVVAPPELAPQPPPEPEEQYVTLPLRSTQHPVD